MACSPSGRTRVELRLLAPPASHLPPTRAGLGSDPETLKYFVQAELVHCRFAMLGAAGIVLTGLATKAGALNVPEWYDAGLVSIKQSGIPLGALIIVQARAPPSRHMQCRADAGRNAETAISAMWLQVLLMGWVETMRIQDFKKPGSQGEGVFLGVTDGLKGTDNGYPGGYFDPMGMDSPTNRQKEVKNGRLAMLACVGFVSQHAATGKGPIDNLFDHISDPGNVRPARCVISLDTCEA